MFPDAWAIWVNWPTWKILCKIFGTCFSCVQPPCSCSKSSYLSNSLIYFLHVQNLLVYHLNNLWMIKTSLSKISYAATKTTSTAKIYHHQPSRRSLRVVNLLNGLSWLFIELDPSRILLFIQKDILMKSMALIES